MPLVRLPPFLLCVLLACTVHTAAAHERAPSARIQRAEPIDLPAAALPSEAALRQSGRPARLRFAAFGRPFELELESNAGILQELPEDQRGALPPHALYKGRLTAIPDSWLRISQVDGRVYGAIWDGTDMYAIAPARAISGLLREPAAGGGNATLIYRAADVESGLGPGFCSPVVPDTADTGGDPYKALAQELTHHKATAAASSMREIAIGLVADREFRRSFADPQGTMLSRLNTVDGIFGAQIGVGVVATELRVLDDDGWLTATAANTLLRQLSLLRTLTAELRNLDLTHLMTGRDLDGRTAGLAYINSVCHRSFGVSLSQQGPDPWTGALLAAHELGHNLGALHDGESNSPCASTPRTFLMAPSIIGNGIFSQCSLDTIAPVVAKASCLAAAGFVDLALEAPATEFNGFTRRPATVAFDVVSLGNRLATSASVTIETGSQLQVASATVADGTCRITTGAVACDLGAVAPGERRRIELQLQGDSTGRYEIAATLAAPLDQDPTNDTRNLTLVLERAADGSLAILPATLNWVEQQVQRLSLEVSTSGAEALTGATVQVAAPADALTVVATNVERGVCTVTPGTIACDLGRLEAATTHRVDLDLRGTRAGTTTIAATLTADNDADSGNNQTSATISVVAATGTPTGGGNGDASGSKRSRRGGGAWDQLLLGLLLAMGLLRGLDDAARRRPAARRPMRTDLSCKQDQSRSGISRHRLR